MKIIIGQPRLEQHLLQLEAELKQHLDADILLFPEGYLNQNVEDACRLAAEYGTMIVSGHRRLDERPKDRSIIISKAGEIVLEKAKYTPAETVEEQGWLISTLLCDEPGPARILQREYRKCGHFDAFHWCGHVQ